MAETAEPTFIRAAGGVVWRDRSRREVAVIYRDRHSRNECCLPKGKLESGEAWERAAMREVLEETGCEAVIRGFGGLLHYYVEERPKVVLYFEMLTLREGAFQPSGEVRHTAWLAPELAMATLTHEGERTLLRQCMLRSDR